MHKMRFVSLLFLVWSLAFLLLPDFRESLQVPFTAWRRGALLRMGALDSDALDAIAREGTEKYDARALAFAGLHTPDDREGAKFADQAVELDPQLTWVLYSMVSRNRYDVAPGTPENPEVDQWIVKLEAWDRGNGLPYLLEGEQIRYRKGTNWPAPENLAALAEQAEWRGAMAKAFSEPHYQSYGARRFELEHELFRRYKLNQPATVLLSFISYPIPDLLNVRAYGTLLIEKIGREAETAGHFSEASEAYRTVAHFGEQMQLNGPTLLEKHIGADLQNSAYERMIPLLRRMGRAREASTVEHSREELLQRLEVMHGRDPLAQSSRYYWAVLAVHLLAALVIVFGVLAILIVGYMNAKRWVRAEKRGRLYQMLVVAENYAPALLFLACLGLYLSYYPFAQNFHRYMSGGDQIHDFEPLFFNVLPNFSGPPGQAGLPLQNPFRPYVWYALAGLGLVVVIQWSLRRREARDASSTVHGRSRG